MGSSNYNLYLETSRGLLSIPCGEIRDIDKFTIRFENRFVFLSALIEMLKLDISVQDIGRVYLSNRDREYIEKHDFDYEICLPIKYGCDNFKLDSLIGYFADYLKKDRSRLENYKKEAELIIPNYDEGRCTDNDIEFFAKRYLEVNYRRQRDEYFFLRKLVDYPIVINAMPKGRHVSYDVDDMDLKTRRKFFDLLQISYSDYPKYEEKLESFTLEDFTNLAKCILLLSPTQEDKDEFEKISKNSIVELQQKLKQKMKRGRR